MERQPISAAEALAWLEDMEARRPRPMTKAEGIVSIPVPSFSAQGTDDGVFLRFPNRDGSKIDIFLNACLAAQMIETLIDIGIRAIWLNEDDRSVIVHDPQNLPGGDQKS